jgi:hypothetical protein
MFRKTQHLGVRNVSMDYAVRYPVSTEFILLTLKAALEKLNNLHEYRRQFTPRHKSPSAKIRTQQWLDLLGVDVFETVSWLFVAETSIAAGAQESALHPRRRHKRKRDDVPLLRKHID